MSRNLLIADSQGKELDIANFNVLSLPGACVRHVYNFIPKKDSYETVNALLASRKEGWKFRGFSRQIYSDKHLKRDNVHLSSNALSGIGYILESKILYKRFCPELEEEGYSHIIECKGICKCLS